MSTSAPLPPETPAPSKKTSGLAIASLILGILGLCTAGLGGLIGLILGIVSLVKIGKSAGQLAGKGVGIAGIVASAASLLLMPLTTGILVAILLPAIMGAREHAQAAACEINVQRLCAAAHAYAVSHNDAFPPAETWPEALKQFGITDETLADPADREAGRGYAMNAAMAGLRMMQVRDRSRTVLFFECVPGGPPAGGPETLLPAPPHPKGYVIGFCDGHSEAVPKKDLGNLIWDPKAEKGQAEPSP